MNIRGYRPIFFPHCFRLNIGDMWNVMCYSLPRKGKKMGNCSYNLGCGILFGETVRFFVIVKVES